MDHVELYTPKGTSLSAGIISFDVKGMKPADAVRALHRKKVIASTSPYAVQTVRVAPSILNTPEEVDRTLEAIRGLRAM
jgi:selenocysteine lyase/cysteine desulfurase